jgi:Tol biopolymer transport system component
MQLKAASGLEKERVIATQVDNGDDFIPNSWSPDGQYIVGSLQGAGGTRLALVKVGVNQTKPLTTSKGNETNGQLSRDGKWLAYASDESGEWEIYVTSFPGAAGKWQVSQGGGTEPRWRADGKELFYINAKGTLMSVQVNTEGGFSTGTPVDLFPLGGRAPISSSDLFSYDVAPDGKRFLVNRYTKPASLPPLDIVLNATK